jgi:hypothetical protein
MFRYNDDGDFGSESFFSRRNMNKKTGTATADDNPRGKPDSVFILF